MTNQQLSPAAQEVLTSAICAGPDLEYRIADALRAINEYVVLPKYQFAEWELAHAIHQEIEAIANELETQ